MAAAHFGGEKKEKKDGRKLAFGSTAGFFEDCSGVRNFDREPEGGSLTVLFPHDMFFLRCDCTQREREREKKKYLA